VVLTAQWERGPCRRRRPLRGRGPPRVCAAMQESLKPTRARVNGPTAEHLRSERARRAQPRRTADSFRTQRGWLPRDPIADLEVVPALQGPPAAGCSTPGCGDGATRWWRSAPTVLKLVSPRSTMSTHRCANAGRRRTTWTRSPRLSSRAGSSSGGERVPGGAGARLPALAVMGQRAGPASCSASSARSAISGTVAPTRSMSEVARRRARATTPSRITAHLK
jgi:hypothetical protein